MRLLGLDDRPPPPHIQEALEISEAAQAAAAEARSAVESYWAARGGREALLDEYDRAERHVRGR